MPGLGCADLDIKEIGWVVLNNYEISLDVDNVN